MDNYTKKPNESEYTYFIVSQLIFDGFREVFESIEQNNYNSTNALVSLCKALENIGKYRFGYQQLRVISNVSPLETRVMSVVNELEKDIQNLQELIGNHTPTLSPSAIYYKLLNIKSHYESRDYENHE